MRLALRAGREFRRDPLAFMLARNEWRDVISFRAGLPVTTISVGDFCAEAEFASVGHSCALKGKGKTLDCKAASPK